MTEKQKYEVIDVFGEVELRHYPACQVASVVVSGDSETAGNRGFRPLVQYISGGNQRRESIAMTAPVIQEPVGPNRYEISFVLPSEYQLSDLPDPEDSKVTVHTVPEHHALVYKFAGTWSDNRFIEAERILRNSLEALVTSKRLSASVSNEVYIARYDPPWKPGFLRRNEVLIKVTPNH